MANVDLVMRLLAEDKASGTFSKVGSAATATERRMDRLKKTAGLISAAGVVAFGVASVKAFSEAQKEQAKLEGAYQRFPKVANVSIESLRDLNSELQKTTVYDDDVVAGAQATLAQFKLTGAQIKQLTPLLLDYASATGKDVTNAATDLGKAMMGQGRALKSVGIDFKATGDTAADLNNLMGALRGQVGGFAEREGKTAAGQAQILSNQFGDLQESVGEALVPALQTLVDIATPMVSTFNALPGPVKTAAVAVTAAGAAALVAVPRIIALREALETTGPAGAKAARGMKTAGKAVGVMAAAFAAASVVGTFSKDAVNASQSADDLAKSLQRLAGGASTDDVGLQFQTFTGRAVDFNEALGLIRDNHWWDQLEGGLASVMNLPANFNLAKESVSGFDEALAAMVSSGNAETAAKAFEQSGIRVDELATLLPNYRTALDNLKAPTKDVTDKTNDQAAALKSVKTALGQLQAVLDKGAARDQWVSALKDIGDQAKDAKGKLRGNSDEALTLRGNLRSSIGDLQAYANGFSNPTTKAKVLKDGLADIRASLIKNGIKPKDADAFLAQFTNIADKAYTDAKSVGTNIGKGVTAGIAASRAEAIAEAQSMGKAAVQAVRRGAEVASPSKYTTWVGKEIANGVTLGIKLRSGQSKAEIEKMTKAAMSAAEKLLAQWKQKVDDWKSMAGSVRDSLVSSGSVTGFQAQDGQEVSTPNVIGSMRQRVAEAKRFVTSIKRLKKLGLNNTSIQEIIAMGPHDGLAVASALLDGGMAAIKEVNSLESQLYRSGKDLGATAATSQYGITAEQVYGKAGVRAKQTGEGRVTVNLTVDGKTLQTVLVDLKRAQGGKLNFQ